MATSSIIQAKIRNLLLGNTEITLDGFVYRYGKLNGHDIIEQCQIMSVNGSRFYRLIYFFVAVR